jgi:leucyl-tRNA synthetase
MDGYACSSWYLWRYADPNNKNAAWDKEKVDFWNPLDFYVGGDHAVAHLLYVRFWAKFFADQGLLNFREPVKKLLYNGYILAPDGTKMSKSKGNVIDPLEVINNGYGADTLRTYELFIGPYDLDAAWDTKAIGGVYRFLNRCWTLVEKQMSVSEDHILAERPASDFLRSEKSCRDERVRGNMAIAFRHKTIKKVTDDLTRASFNTAVAALMEFVNELYKTEHTQDDLATLAKLLKPFAPHLASELLEKLSADDSWPTYDEKYLIEDEVDLIVQVNGKVRAKIRIASESLTSDTKLQEIALNDENIKKNLEGKTLIKAIIIAKNKLINLVIK